MRTLRGQLLDWSNVFNLLYVELLLLDIALQYYVVATRSITLENLRYIFLSRLINVKFLYLIYAKAEFNCLI